MTSPTPRQSAAPPRALLSGIFNHLISILALICICLTCSIAQAITIAADGKSDYVIVLASQPMPANERAAHELNLHLKQMAGVELPIQNDDQPAPDHAILIGPSKALDAVGVKLDPKLGNDGFLLKTIGNRLIIAGPGPRGSMYGVSDVLEKLGVRWFTPTVTRIPTKSTVELPHLDQTQTPAFEYREPGFFEATDKDWAARNRVIGQSPNLDASTGGTIKYAQFVHSLDTLVPRSLYKTHPEYFPLINGKRVDGYVQRCLSNPAVLKIAIDNVREQFKEHPDAVITSVSQDDAGSWCQCDDCKKLAAKYGGQSGLYLWFVNQVAEQIGKEMPGKLIGTLAYQFTEAPPKNIVPARNVRVRLCPINVCEAQPYETDTFPATQAFMKNLAGWGSITNTLYIWHYSTDFANYLMPFPDFNQFPDSIRLYRKSGVRGIFFEGDYANGGGGSDAELRSWVMAKLLWNPDLDASKLVTEWMQGVYGPAWKPMRAWFDLLHDKVRDPNQHFFIYSAPNIYYLSPDVISQGDKLFAEAEKLAGNDDAAKSYVAKARLSLRYVELEQHPEAGPPLDSFIADVRKAGIKEIREGQPVDAWEKEFRTKIKK